MAGPANEFERHRPRLRGLAYRMLGSVADAEDVLQDAYLRWHGARGVREPVAWLTTAVTRLCIDWLRARETRQQTYVGPWLPEPWVGNPSEPPDRRQDRADDLSVAFLLMLERLAPEERAALLLHDVFDIGYPDIATTLDKTEAACRQLVYRARERVRTDRPRFTVSDSERRALLDRFLAAVRAGDERQVLALLAPEATLTSDGGGKTWAALNVIRGAAKVARLLLAVARKAPPGIEDRRAWVNGEPAAVIWLASRPHATLSVDVDDGRITAIYQVMNPDKLGGLVASPQKNPGHPVTSASGDRQGSEVDGPAVTATRDRGRYATPPEPLPSLPRSL